MRREGRFAEARDLLKQAGDGFHSTGFDEMRALIGGFGYGALRFQSLLRWETSAILSEFCLSCAQSEHGNLVRSVVDGCQTGKPKM